MFMCADYTPHKRSDLPVETEEAGLISSYQRWPVAFVLCNKVRATLNCQLVHISFSIAVLENE